MRNSQARPEERFKAFEPFWKRARFTGYGKALRLALKEIYGIDEISAGTLPLLNKRIRAENKPGLYEKILRDRAKIRYSILDDYWNALPVKPDSRFFLLARNFLRRSR